MRCILTPRLLYISDRYVIEFQPVYGRIIAIKKILVRRLMEYHYLIFSQARAIYELAKKVFHVLKTAPEKLELEFPVTRQRSCRRPKGEGKSLNFNSCRRVTTNFRTKSSSSGPSNLGRSIWGNPGFTSTSKKRDNDFSPGKM